jgi:hypothetical protein
LAASPFDLRADSAADTQVSADAQILASLSGIANAGHPENSRPIRVAQRPQRISDRRQVRSILECMAVFMAARRNFFAFYKRIQRTFESRWGHSTDSRRRTCSRCGSAT